VRQGVIAQAQATFEETRLRYERPARHKRLPVHRRTHRLQHLGDCRDCGSAGAERPLHEARPLYDSIIEFRRKNLRASIPEMAFPEPYLLTEAENKIIDDILKLLNKHGLTLHQSMNLLDRLGESLRWDSKWRRERHTSDVVPATLS
jgi:hypothetical protein